MERLNKVIANAGIASRRKADELIQSGAVTVNDIVCDKLGMQVSSKDVIKVNGKALYKEEKVYYVMNKPASYITTVSDDKGRKTVMDLFTEADKKQRIYPIGRLDYDTSGVLLFTNDGTLANKLTSSKNNIEKEYNARIEGLISLDELKTLANGVIINGIRTKKCRAYLISKDKVNNSSFVKLIISEGKYHQVKLMFEAIGHKVKKLTRVRFANITIDGLKKGEYRELKIHEIKSLYGI